MALWSRNKAKCRSVGGIVQDARDGKLPGVRAADHGASFEVTDETAALAAMRKGTA